MHPMLNIAIRSAKEAGEQIRRYAGQAHRIAREEKSANDYVTDVDRQAELMITQALQKAYPEHAILAEESGLMGEEKAEYQWIIDPLDGTTNFLHGLGHFAVSIALKHQGRLLVAVVYDPMADECFAAARGEGATLNGRRIRIRTTESIDGALLATGVPFKVGSNIALYNQTLAAMLPDTAGVRRFGSAALDLAYLAAGRFDGFWEFGLAPWDFAAGALLVQESGGILTDLNGQYQHFETGNVLAGSPKVYKAMLKRLHPILKS